jgi:hypothetical protein
LKRFVLSFIQGIGLGLGIGLCLAGAVAILYRSIHGVSPHSGSVMVYFFVVGGLTGFLGGWALALQMVIGNLLSSLMLKILELVPLPASEVGEEWGKKIEFFFHEILKPVPGLLQKFAEFFLVARFADYSRLNRAINRAKQKTPLQRYSPQWMSLVVLHYFLEPLWVIFYIVCAILFLIACVIWSFPFFR